MMKTLFDTAWDLVKADTGMWDEIYADLYEKLGGRGRGKTDNTGGPGYKGVPLDFMPTDVAMKILNQNILMGEPNIVQQPQGRTPLEEFRENSQGDHGNTVESLIESIMENGFRLDDKGRYNYVVPNFTFDYNGNVQQLEGRHRTQALFEMGAPYIPSAGRGEWNIDTSKFMPKAIKNPFNKINPIFSVRPSQHSAAAHFGPDKHSYQTPPSWIFDQELVPGMGRLLPVIDGKPISDEKMLQHQNKVGMNDWVHHPEWKVFHD
jgi:hypothetical protein